MIIIGFPTLIMLALLFSKGFRKAVGFLILLVICIVAWSSALHAQETEYAYTGAALTDTVIPPTGWAPEMIPTSITGDIILSAALNPNEANQIVTPLSFAFTSQENYLSSNVGVQNFTGESFSFSTQNGVITGWSVDLDTTTIGTNSPLLVNAAITSSGDSYYALQAAQSCGIGGGLALGETSNCYLVTGSNSVGGTWVDPPIGGYAAPEIDPAGLPEMLTLLIGLLLVARGTVPRGTAR